MRGTLGEEDKKIGVTTDFNEFISLVDFGELLACFLKNEKHLSESNGYNYVFLQYLFMIIEKNWDNIDFEDIREEIKKIYGLFIDGENGK